MESGSSENTSPDPSRHHRSHHHTSSHRSRQTSNEHTHSRSHSSSGEHDPSSSSDRLHGKRQPHSRFKRRGKHSKSFVSKHLAKIVGILFLGYISWLFFISFDKMIRSLSLFVDDLPDLAEIFIRVVKNPGLISLDSTSSFDSGSSYPHLFYFLTIGIVILIQLFAIWRKSLLFFAIAFIAWILFGSWWFITAGILPLKLNMVKLVTFSIANSLFFLLFFLSTLRSSFVVDKNWTRTLIHVMIFLNAIFYLFTESVILLELFDNHYRLAFFMGIVCIVMGIAIYFFGKSKEKDSNLKYSLILLALVVSLFLPFAFQLRLNFPVLYFAPLSLLLLLATRVEKSPQFIVLSFIATIFAFTGYIFEWVFNTIPHFLIKGYPITTSLFFEGLICGALLTTTTGVGLFTLRRLKLPATSKRLRQGTVLKATKGLFLLAIFLTGLWLFHFLLLAAFPSPGLSLMVIALYTCLYFICVIPILHWQRSSFYLKLFSLISMVVVLLLPPFISWITYRVEVHFLEGKSLKYTAFMFHFLVFAAILTLVMFLLKYFKSAFRKNLTMLKIFRVFFYLIIGVILLFELNHLLFFTAVAKGMIQTFSFGKYSLVTSLVGMLYASFVLFRGFASRAGYLRIFAIVAILAMMVKVLVYDSRFMDENTKYLSYLSIGLLILVGWVVYPKMVKRSSNHSHRKRGKQHTNQDHRKQRKQVNKSHEL